MDWKQLLNVDIALCVMEFLPYIDRQNIQCTNKIFGNASGVLRKEDKTNPKKYIYAHAADKMIVMPPGNTAMIHLYNKKNSATFVEIVRGGKHNLVTYRRSGNIDKVPVHSVDKLEWSPNYICGVYSKNNPNEMFGYLHDAQPTRTKVYDPELKKSINAQFVPWNVSDSGSLYIDPYFYIYPTYIVNIWKTSDNKWIIQTFGKLLVIDIKSRKKLIR